MENRDWLVFANRNMCHHAEALHDLGFINWKEGSTKMHIGDIVYLYMSDERRVRFKTQVVAVGCKREDGKYWRKSCSDDLTFKLELREEYDGKELNEKILRKHGFNGGRSIQRPMYKNKTLFMYIENVFAKDMYKNVIDELIPQERTRELVKKTIPILIRWAKQGLLNKTYGDLIKELGYVHFSYVGKLLGRIDDVFKRFCELANEDNPTLNALVKSESTRLPSDGFDYVYPSYVSMSDEEKKIFVTGLNKKAVEYEHWDWVMLMLGLTPSIIDLKESESLIRSGKFLCKGGEGEMHKKIKEYIFNHPDFVGIESFNVREMERVLLSGDRLDVYFELTDGSKIAVEVKPSTSSDADIMRGLFQCVKYKSILDAEDKIQGKKTFNKVVLVIGGNLSHENRMVQDILGISVSTINLDLLN